MPYYIFKNNIGGTARYVTDDRSGAKLPKPVAGSKWVFERQVNLTAGATGTIGPTHDDALAGIKKDGYFKIP